MSSNDRNDVFKKLFFSIWAMLTLILFFTVALLVNEMIRQGQDPLGFLETETQAAGLTPAPSVPAPPGSEREVLLYFSSPDGNALAPERRRIALTQSTTENCRLLLQALISGPRDMLSPILPGTARIRALYLLEDGELVVDLSRELLAEHAQFKSMTLEALMFYGMVNTVTQSIVKGEEEPAVQRVRFLIEGLPPQEIFPAHLDLARPLGPNPRWVAAQGGRAPDA